MANWTALTFAYGTKLTSSQMTKLSDNITAAWEGASGSPGFVSTVGSSFYLASGVIPVPTSYTAYHKLKEYEVLSTGPLRIGMYLDAILGTIYGRIYRNGSAVGTARSTGSEGTYVEDITSWSPGDKLQFYAYTSSGAGTIYAWAMSGVRSVPLVDLTEVMGLI